jgi:nucleoside-diphosphate-sugar epimerase
VNIAVSGASGFIGSNLTARLSARGDRVRAVRRPFDRPELVETLRGCDVVVHLAGVITATRSEEYVAGNVTAARLVAEATRVVGARLVHVSSLAAAGPAPREAPRAEADPPAPMTAYGRTKLEGERAIKEVTGLRWTILRPGVVYGPHDRAVLALFRMARSGFLPLVGRDGAAYMMIHVSDLVRAIQAAIDRVDVSGETVFVAHPEPVTARALVEAIRDTAGGTAAIVRIPRPVVSIAAAAGDAIGRLRGKPMVINRRRYAELYAEGFVCRVDRLRERLGVVAQIGLREGLAETAEWYRANGWLSS